jgi:glycerol-3-phosphate acyltransferase PlsY
MVILLAFIAITDYAAPGVIAVSSVMIFLFRIFGTDGNISSADTIAVIMIARNLENIQRILREKNRAESAHKKEERGPATGA